MFKLLPANIAVDSKQDGYELSYYFVAFLDVLGQKEKLQELIGVL